MVYIENRRLNYDPSHREHVEFVRLWATASPRIHVFILAMVANWADADDLLQDVGVTAWEKFYEYDRDRDFASWACGIAKNKVLSHRRQEARQLVQSMELAKRIEQALAAEPCSLERRREALRKCLDRLSESQLRLLSISETPGATLKSVAAEAGRSVEAIYKSVQRIRLRLFRCVTRRMRDWKEP